MSADSKYPQWIEEERAQARHGLASVTQTLHFLQDKNGDYALALAAIRDVRRQVVDLLAAAPDVLLATAKPVQMRDDEPVAQATPKDTGGPAFPVMPPVDDSGRTAVSYPFPSDGMTLRDHFAGQVCAAMLTTTSANSGFVNPAHRRSPGQEMLADRVARAAYVMADAMIKARSACL